MITTVRRFAHLAALIAFAIAQPLYQVLGESPTFLVAHRATGADVWFLCLISLIVAPAGLLVLERAAGLAWRPAAIALRIVATFVLCTLFFCLMTRNVSWNDSATLSLGFAAAAGSLFTYLYETRGAIRDFLSICGLAAPVLAGLFLMSPGIRPMIWPEPATDLQSNPILKKHTDTPLAPIVMVVFDEFGTTALLDPDTLDIDSRRFPNFAALAERSTFFRRATTISPWTSTAVPTILTGRWPLGNEAPPQVESYPQNLFTLLAPYYAMNVHEGLTRLCPNELCPVKGPSAPERLGRMLADLAVVYGHVVLPTTLREHLPSVAHQWAGFAATDEGPPNVGRSESSNGHNFLSTATPQMKGDRAGVLEDFLKSVPRAGRPGISFIHVLLPHHPWVYLPSGHRYGSFRDHGRIHGSRWGDVPELVALSYQRYLLQIGFLDSFLGKLTASLQREGTWDESLVIVVADHGANFRSGQAFRPVTPESLDEVLPVPLFVKLPHQKAGKLDLRTVQLVDLLPTIVDAVGLESSVEFDGRSLLDPEYTGRNPVRIFPQRERDSAMEIDPDVATAFGFLETKRRLFEGAPDEWPFALSAEYDVLLGQPVDEVGIGPDVPNRAEIDGIDSLRQIAADVVHLPALLAATVTRIPGIEPPYPVAVSINGIVRGVTKTTIEINESGGPRYAEPRILMVLPEGFLTPGAKEVALWLISVEGEEARPSLRRIPLSGGGAAWIRGPDSSGSLERDGKRWVIEDRAALGSLDAITQPDPTGPIIFSGWAIDAKRGAPVSEVVAFKGNVMVGSSIPSIPRTGVETLHGAAARNAGFTLTVLADALGDYEPEDITIFGLTTTGSATALSNRPALAAR